jgi:catechol 2,3-dioxygenase-like lactoylglutathione lyase family enzyme
VKYLHTMLRVLDLDAALSFFGVFGLEEVRRKRVPAGRFALVFLATGPGAPEAESPDDVHRDPTGPLTVATAGALGLYGERGYLVARLGFGASQLRPHEDCQTCLRPKSRGLESADSPLTKRSIVPPNEVPSADYMEWFSTTPGAEPPPQGENFCRREAPQAA